MYIDKKCKNVLNYDVQRAIMTKVILCYFEVQHYVGEIRYLCFVF